MKNLFFGLIMLAGTSATFANSNVETIENNLNNDKSETTVVKCYRKAVDDFGNAYYVQVTCPEKVVIVSAQ